MPVDKLGLTMKPYGFFGRNPALDVPRPKSGHCDTVRPVTPASATDRRRR